MTQSILILDKDEALCDELADLLRDAGYKPSFGLDGQAGKRLLEDREYDLVLLGLELSEDDESDLLLAIRERGIRTKVLVLIRAHSSARASGWDLTDGFLSKPLVIPALLEKVTDLIGQGRGAGSSIKAESLPPEQNSGTGNE